jgi:hypothetical protein
VVRDAPLAVLDHGDGQAHELLDLGREVAVGDRRLVELAEALPHRG